MNFSAFTMILLFALSIPVSALAASNNSNILYLQNSQYVSSGANFYREGAGTDNSSISVWVRREGRLLRGATYKAVIKDEYSSSEKWNYLNFYELYAETRPWGLSLSTGRKLETWSSADDDWKQGVYLPRYLQNKLNPELAGLSGFFLKGEKKNLLWILGVLPLHVPDLGAHFSTEDHKFVSRNPWFIPPASAFRFNNTDGAIRYSVDQPSAQKIVSNPGVIAKVDVGDRRFGVRAAGAYKPMSTFLVGFPSLNKVIVGASEDYLKVAVTPQVIYHWVASTETWADIGRRWSMNLGLTHDHAVTDGFKEGWTLQTFSPAWIWSGSLIRFLEDEGPDAARLKLSFVKIAGGAAADRGVFATDKSKFEKRFQYDEAYSLGVLLPLRGVFKRPLSMESKIIYDRMQNGGLFAFSLGYSVAPGWRVDGEVEFLGLVGAQAESESGFFSTYRANDRVGVGTSYVF